MLKCEEKMLRVVEEPSICTEELQVFESEDKIAYVKPGTGILQNTFIEEDCNGMRVHKVFHDARKTQQVYIIQYEEISKFHGITGTIMEHSQLFEEKLEMDDLLQYPDFRDSGLYSQEYLQARRKQLFADEELEAATAGINRFLGKASTAGAGNTEELDLLQLIKPDALFELIFGSSIIQGIILGLNILSYLRYLFKHLLYFVNNLLNLSQWC